MAIEKLVADLSRGKPEPRPFFVWFFDKSDEKTNRRLEQSVFASPDATMFLLPFRRVKIDLDAVRDPALRESHGPAPRFVILDPPGREIGCLSGKRATSPNATTAFLRKAWPTLFTFELENYRKKMRKNLGREDSILGKESVIRAKRGRLKLKPSPKVSARLDREATRLAEIRAAMEKERREILALCLLRPECRAPAPKKE